MLEKRVVYHSFKFFLFQAVAITFEDLAIYVAKHLLRREKSNSSREEPTNLGQTWL